MILSHTHKFVLLSPWKTASSTCHARLERYNESIYDRFFAFNPHLNRVVHQHITLAEFLALPESQLGYKTATFVRNPYDRAYSGFVQIQRDFEDQPKRDFNPGWIGNLVREQITENMSRVISAGFDFDEWLRILPDHEVFDVGRNTNMCLHPAHYWTHVNNRQEVGFIGKVENFESDFKTFCDLVGIETPPILNSNLSQPDERSESGSGSRYAGRMSRRSLDRINDLFADDFKWFNYGKL